MFRIILTSLLTAAAFSSAAADFAHPPGTSIKGRSAPQLTTEWWQWTMSTPDNVNPVRDTSGTNCGVGQNGPVWFLAGGFGSSKVRRTCSVPEGKALFFPLVNAAYWNNNDQLTVTCDEAKAAAAMTNQTAIDLFAEIDGVAIDGLKNIESHPRNALTYLLGCRRISALTARFHRPRMAIGYCSNRCPKGATFSSLAASTTEPPTPMAAWFKTLNMN